MPSSLASASWVSLNFPRNSFISFILVVYTCNRPTSSSLCQPCKIYFARVLDKCLLSFILYVDMQVLVEDIISIRQAAKIIGVSGRTLYNHVYLQRDVPFFKIDCHPFLLRSQIEAVKLVINTVKNTVKHQSANKSARNAFLLQYRKEHRSESLKEIGRIFNISKQRVSKILKRANEVAEGDDGRL